MVEVNASPSLSASTPTDYELKFGTLEDLLMIIDMEAQLYGDEEQVGSFDLVWDGAYVPNKRDRAMRNNRKKGQDPRASPVVARADNPDYGPLKGYSLLGCANDRESQHRRMHRETNVKAALKRKYKGKVW